MQIGYGDHVVVDDLDICISKNKITSIIGPNGSGKSTVLKSLTRLLRYQKGTVSIDGVIFGISAQRSWPAEWECCPRFTPLRRTFGSKSWWAMAACLTRDCFQD